MFATILRKRLFWLCVALVILCIGASVTLNRIAYDFCAGGELTANWVCNYGAKQVFNVDYVATPADVVAGTPAAIKPSLVSTPKPWNGSERVNVLVMGIDQRQGETDVGYRTDTMIVLTLDPVTLQAGMLSIPRDLWVPIPGYDNGRINTANFLGDAYPYPGGGPALARKTVEQLLGIPISFYARVNFTAFEEFVDRIGGITVDVPEDIYDPEYPTNDYGTEVFSITKGIHNMDGATALKFARTRHSLTNGDFDRARDQQLVMLGVKDKLTNPQVFLSLLSSGPGLISKLNAAVKTDLTLDQMQQLAALALKVDRKNIKTAVLDQTYTDFASTLTNPPQWVQVPIRSKVAQLRDSFFAASPDSAIEASNDPSATATVQPTSTATSPVTWKDENARISVLNGTPRAGFAQKAADSLSARGFNVVHVGNTPDGRMDYDHTIITDYTGKKMTLETLPGELNITGSAELKRLVAPNEDADIVIILGSDINLP